MAGLHTGTAPTVEQLVEAVKQLPPNDFKRFERAWEQVRHSREKEDIERLRAAANYRLPQTKQERLEELLYKGNVGTLTPKEQSELNRLLEFIDRKNLEKARAMHQLSQLEKAEDESSSRRANATILASGRAASSSVAGGVWRDG